MQLINATYVDYHNRNSIGPFSDND